MLFKLRCALRHVSCLLGAAILPSLATCSALRTLGSSWQQTTLSTVCLVCSRWLAAWIACCSNYSCALETNQSPCGCCAHQLLSSICFACAVPANVCWPAPRLHLDQHLASSRAAAALPLCLLHVSMGECRPRPHTVGLQPARQARQAKHNH